MHARIFKCMFLPTELEIGTKALQFDVCCEANDRNFNCGFIPKNVQIYINPSKKNTI